MIRRLGVLGGSLLVAAAVLGAPTATAEPTAPSCVYTLSSPRVVQVSNSTMVTVTLKPYPCSGSINPNYLSVCLRAQDGSGPGNCGFSSIPSFAEVFVPYRPGTTYVATGTGCGSVYTAEGSICSSVGPFTTTL